MKKQLFIVAALIVLPSLLFPAFVQAKDDINVIFITYDGVRPDEFFGKPDPKLLEGDDNLLFEYFWSEMADKGTIYGDPKNNSQMLVSNTALISLPGYMGIFAGFPTNCMDNKCGQATWETFPERIQRQLNLPKNKVAAISSWDKVAKAAESRMGKILVNAGVVPLSDGTKDAEFKKINEAQAKDLPPWPECRLDKYTFAHAMHFLKKHRPRFLYIGLNESDDIAHEKKYDGYVAAIRQFDRMLKELRDTLKKMGSYGRKTAIVISADHGRGLGNEWHDHGTKIPYSKNIWMYISSPHKGFKPVKIKNSVHTQSDIGPTIEALFGLKPYECETCGKPVKEVLTRN